MMKVHQPERRESVTRRAHYAATMLRLIPAAAAAATAADARKKN